jgi:hypothetical protein
MAARILARYLRQVQKCDVVIAITHMRLAEDLKVADATAAQDDCHINLLLGGHDHEVVCRVAGDTCSDASRIWQNAANDDIIRKGRVITRSGKVRIVKSGSDFQSFSKIRLLVQRTSKGKVSVIKTTGTVIMRFKLNWHNEVLIYVLIVRQVADLSLTRRYIVSKPHPVVRKHLLDIQSHLSQLIATPLAKIGSPMDGRETLMRSQETNLGNFLCDMLKLYYDTDVAFTNSGSIRSDRILGSHDDMECLEQAKAASSLLRVRDVLGNAVLLNYLYLHRSILMFWRADMLPFRDTFEIKLLAGRDLRHILEVSVSENSPEGKFLQISGVSFEVNKKRQPGCRVSKIQLLTPIDQQRGEQDRHQAGPSVAIHSDRLYTAVLPSFLARGYDGYDAIRDLPTVHRKGLDERMTHAELMLRVLGHTITRKGHCFDSDLNTDDSSDRSTVGGSSGTPHLELDSDDKQTFLVSNGNDSLSSDISQVERGALARARRGLVKEYCETTNLPVVFSTLPGRVRFLNCTRDY